MKINDKEIRGLKCFEQVAPHLENDLKDNSVVDISLVETRLYYKKGRKYKVERFNSLKEAARLGKKLLPRHLDRECVYAVALNAKMEPLAVQLMSIGSMDATILDPARIFTFLLLCGAHSFVLFHNHISGDTTPSNDDISSTKRLKEAAHIVGIKLNDHIIIGDGFTSLKELGYV